MIFSLYICNMHLVTLKKLLYVDRLQPQVMYMSVNTMNYNNL